VIEEALFHIVYAARRNAGQVSTMMVHWSMDDHRSQNCPTTAPLSWQIRKAARQHVVLAVNHMKAMQQTQQTRGSPCRCSTADIYLLMRKPARRAPGTNLVTCGGQQASINYVPGL